MSSLVRGSVLWATAALLFGCTQDKRQSGGKIPGLRSAFELECPFTVSLQTRVPESLSEQRACAFLYRSQESGNYTLFLTLFGPNAFGSKDAIDIAFTNRQAFVPGTYEKNTPGYVLTANYNIDEGTVDSTPVRAKLDGDSTLSVTRYPSGNGGEVEITFAVSLQCTENCLKAIVPITLTGTVRGTCRYRSETSGSLRYELCDRGSGS